MVAHTELGGWLPASVVNSAVPDAFREIFAGLASLLAEKGVGTLVPP